jgi:hypothetical protein
MENLKSKRTHRHFDRLLLSSGVLGLAAVVLLLAPCRAQTEFRELIGRLPSSTNAVVILNLDKMKASPLGVREGFAANLEKSFRAGLVRVPPHATRFITASQLDLEFMKPIYEVAVCDLDRQLSLETIAQEYSGTMDTLDNLAALHLPTDAYVVQFGPQTFGVMRPANRQAVLGWIRQTAPGTGLQLSPYLQQAAGYSDDAGTDIIMAIDFGGAFSWETVGRYLKGQQAMLDEARVDIKQATDTLAGIEGLRVGIRIGEQPTATIAVDFKDPVTLPAEFAKKLLIDTLDEAGAHFDDLSPWQCSVSGKVISLSGTLSRDGLRRLGSLIDSPAPAHAASAEGEGFVSPGDPKGKTIAASQDYFKSINEMFDDLKQDWKGLKTLASGAIYFDRYARRIEQLPTLNVDKDLVDYGHDVAKQMRAASGAVRTMGIRGGARKAQVTGYDVASGDSYAYYTPYGGYRFGWSSGGPQGEYDNVKQVGAERRKIEAQERGEMATSVFTIRDSVVAATTEVREGLTDRYQVQF